MEAVRVERAFASHHLQKAEECASLMEYALGTQRYNVAVILAVHCAISAADALTISKLELRHSGQSHHGIVELLHHINDPEGKKRTLQLGNLLQPKGAAEYRSDLMTATQARTAVAQAQRFYAWVKGSIQK